MTQVNYVVRNDAPFNPCGGGINLRLWVISKYITLQPTAYEVERLLPVPSVSSHE